jgi:hypothetical protein
LQTLGNAALEFAHFIRMNYTQPPNV